jgi:arabinose-5-phosphate isomerase
VSDEGVLFQQEDPLDAARRVIRMEAEAVASLESRIDLHFARAVDTVFRATGRVIVSGLGKSGIIGRKIAATLTSTGTPAVYLHPVEALHGDLGIVKSDDVAILVSKSGESEELHGLLQCLVRADVAIIALTGKPDSLLARQARVVVNCDVRDEACPHSLAPTCSTTATLAMGDALAIALLLRRGFKAEDFARLHPGGILGRRLLFRVRDLMVVDDLPLATPEATMRDCVVLLAERRGTVAVVDERRRLVGVVTSGDLTRLMEREQEFLSVPAARVMTRQPKTTEPDELAAAAAGLMERARVMALPVLDRDHRVVGMVHLHDIMRAGVV